MRHRMDLQSCMHTSLKSMSMLERPRGSKPTSPGEVPSRFFGTGMKGIDLLLAMLRELAGVRTARCTGVGAMKAEAPVRSAANEAKAVFMVLKVWCRVPSGLDLYIRVEREQKDALLLLVNSCT